MLQNKKGVTLVEVMISLVILMVVFMGLIQASLLSIQSNMKNVLRDEAVRIASDRMSHLRAVAFTTLTTDALLDVGTDVLDDLDPLTAGVQNPITRNARNATVQFTVKKTIIKLDDDHKQISLTVTWSWKGETHTHTIVNTRERT